MRETGSPRRLRRPNGFRIGDEPPVVRPSDCLETPRRVLRSAFNSLCSARPEMIPFTPVFRGRHWSKDVELDVVFLDESRKHALVAEVKWSKMRPRAALLDDLRARTARVPELAGCAITYALVTRAPGPLERKLRADERFVTFSGWRVGGRVSPGV